MTSNGTIMCSGTVLGNQIWFSLCYFVLVLLVLYLLLTILSRLMPPFPKPVGSWAWFLKISVASALLVLCLFISFLEDLSTPPHCCLPLFLMGRFQFASIKVWLLTGLPPVGHICGCSDDLRCVSGEIFSDSRLSSSTGGSSTDTRWATREDGSTDVTTRVTLKGNGSWEKRKKN